MKLHNTLTRTTNEFAPLEPGQVTLYTCGPTVYSHAHIGNLRKFVFDDTLRRMLTTAGLEVRHVMNVTDVGHLASDADEGEDKLEKGAAREGRSVWDVAASYTEAFKRDMAALNILPPNVNPGRSKNGKDDGYARATDFIAEQLDMVSLLLARGFAYKTEQAVYFEVAKLASYGELTGQRLADKEVGVRSDVVTDPDKRAPHDFAVWFFCVGHFADHTMRWPSKLAGLSDLPDGFPGWHLECSAIIQALLDADGLAPIDIHTGGVDHIGTHHPNEMAQTEGAYGHALARIWMHSEFILAGGAKMSKSKDNFYTLASLGEAGFAPLVYRLLCLQAHYRSELSFSLESMAAARNSLVNLYAWADLRHQTERGPVRPYYEAFVEDVIFKLEQDLDTPGALATIYEQISEDDERPSLEEFDMALPVIDDLLGLNLYGRPDITGDQNDLIARRESARRAREWAMADQLRDQLAADNLAVDDTPYGPRWRRTTI